MPDRLLTVAEAGELLGTGERFVRRLIAQRRIRYIKLGRPVRVPESAIAEFIEARTVEPRHRTRPRPLAGPRPRPGSRYGRAA